MAAKTPIRGDYNGSDLVGIAEFQASEFIDIADGGTGATNASDARTALGLAIGSDVQAYHVNLADISSLAVTDGGIIVGDGNNFVLETGNTARLSLGLGTTDSPTFNNLVLDGNLTVNGTQTILNTETLTVDDNTIVLNNNVTGTPTEDAGIEIERGSDTNVSLLWDETNNRWTVGSYDFVAANFIGNVTGQVSDISNFDTGDLVEGSNLYYTEERVDDRVAALLLDSTTSGIDISYDDNANSLTISTDLTEIIESLQDNIEGLFVGGTGVSATYNDVANQLELAIDFSEFDSGSITEGSNLFFTDERVDDRIAALLVDANTEGIDVSYDDSGNQLTLSVDLTEIVESLQDNVQSLFSGGTGITAVYDDNANTLSLSIDFTEFDTDDLVEGTTNLFYTEGRFDTSFAGKSTTDLSEGTNLYYTTTRANTDIDARVTKSFVDALNVDADTLDGNDSTAFATAAQGTLADSAVQPGDNISTLTNDSNFIDLTDLSVTDSGGDGSLSYNNATGVITYTGPSQAEVLAHISGGTGITISGAGVIATTITQYSDADVQSYLSGGTGVTLSASGEFSIGQAVATTDNVTFNNVTVDGVLNSNDITAANISIDGNATITGNLTVEGTTTQVDSTTVTVADPLFKYAKDNTGNSVDIGFYGKYVQSSTTKYAGLAWDASQSDKFRLFHGLQTEPTTTVDITATGHTVGTLIANLEGNVTGALTGNADTATALASGQNFSLTGDVTASAISFDGTGAVALTTTVTESAVTQHQAALSITESQISDLQSYLTAETNDLSSVVTWANVPDANITESSVTQHQAALSITESQISDLGSYITATSTDTLTNKTINFENNTAIVEYSVTVSGGKFVIDGESQATISFNPGIVYRFDLSDSTTASHPFALSITEDGSHNSGSEYTTGKTTNGSQGSAGAYVEYTVNAATPDILYYYCSSHSGMGGTVTVFGSSYGDADVQAYISAGSGISISGSGQISSTITQYADADVQSYLSAGAGISISGSGQISSTITQYSDSDAQAVSINNVVEDTSPQLGGNLDLNSNDITGTGNISTTGTLSLTNTTTSDTLLLTTTEDSSSAAPVLTFKRNSSSPANADYIGQLKFKGENDADQEVVYAKITGKISDVTDTTEDGLIEFALRKAGSNNIGARLTSTDLQLLNGTGLTVAGDAIITGDLTVNGTTTTINTTNTVVSDSLIELGNGTSGSPANDAGLVIERGSSDNAFIGWDESSDKFIVGTGSFTGADTGNLTITTGTLLANLEGNVTGTVSDISNHSTSDLSEGTNLYFTNARADARIAAANLEDLSNVGFSAPGSSENNKVVFWDNSAGAFGLSSVSGLAGSGETNTASNIGTAGVGLFDGKVGEDLQFKKLNAGSAKITITDDTSNNEVDIDLGSVSVGDLSDVDITTSAPTNGQALVWNASNSEFEPGTVASSTNYFQTVAVSGQSDIVPDSTTDTLNFAAGSNITITTDASTDTITIASTDTNTQLTQEQVEDFVNGVIVAGANITKTYDDAAGTLTIAATGGAANAFSTLAVAGQSNVVADSDTDTLTLAAGTGMTITTDAGTDTITFESQGGGGGSLPVILAGTTSDPIVLSDITVAGAIPFTNFDGTTDNIQLGSTQTAVTTFTDNDGDTKLEVERTTDNDTVHIKAGGTDVVTATSSGVTITNLTVTGTTTQANELKITDTIFELNADGGSLTTDAGMIVERGSTGNNASFLWDESLDAWVAGTTTEDGSASSNVSYTLGDLHAKTQNQGDNTTRVATTGYVDTALGSLSSNSITDADGDTKIQVEESSDEDIIRVDTAGQERLTIDNNVSMSARGGFFTHNLTMDSNETFTIAATEGTVAAGPLDVQGTVDVQGSLVVL